MDLVPIIPASIVDSRHDELGNDVVLLSAFLLKVTSNQTLNNQTLTIFMLLKRIHII
jgi:hypothetical protein